MLFRVALAQTLVAFLAADDGFVGFDDFAFAAHGRGAGFLHRLADAADEWRWTPAIGCRSALRTVAGEGGARRTAYSAANTISLAT
jgi:hypothetical protein